MSTSSASPAEGGPRWGPTSPGRLFVLRHAESTANVEGLICSAPGPRALHEVGLTARGREQARGVATQGRDRDALGPETVVVSSDYARALQTARIFAAGIGADAPRIDQRLRERFFGSHDEGPASAYDLVWAFDGDGRDPDGGVEPVRAVAARVRAALADADALAADGPDVVLVAHGDVLQIALAIGEGMDPYTHREVPHLGNAELRHLGGGR